jgi:diguanylate cyclase (GGDEF)-like protein
VQAIGKTDFDFFTMEHAHQAYEDEQEIIQTGRPLIKEEKETWIDRPDTWVSTIKMPMRDNEGNVIGTFGISTDITGRKQMEEELRGAKDDLETALLKLQQSLERETLLADTDGLTGLCNRRHFFELAAREFQAAVRYQHPLAFVMFDLDYFKQINDTLGHTAGDKLMVEVAQIAASQVRASDLVARYGGDEFIVLLPYASAQQALAVAERIRAGVAAIPMDAFRDDKEPFIITLSIGIAEMRHEPADDNVERIIQRADDALYEAKRSGRNRTVVFGRGEL